MWGRTKKLTNAVKHTEEHLKPMSNAAGGYSRTRCSRLICKPKNVPYNDKYTNLIPQQGKEEIMENVGETIHKAKDCSQLSQNNYP